MSWVFDQGAREQVVEFLRAAGEVTTMRVATHRCSSHGSAYQLLCALRDDGVVAARHGEGRLSRAALWVLTGAPLPAGGTATQDASRGAQALRWDHRALSAAMRVCVTPPTAPAAARVYTIAGGEG